MEFSPILTSYYREKHGVVRNDFLNNLIELRKEGMRLDKQPNRSTPEDGNKEPKFSKLFTTSVEPNFSKAI
jgi:hypothetical protein